jgi:Mn-dependent DtxR family transcriptional regulator
MKPATKAKKPSKGSGETREKVLAKILALIKDNPGIRPSEINRRLNLAQSDALRDALIRQGLVRKVKEGTATHLYAK